MLDLLDERAGKLGVFPVGRLDKDTHGLLLLTNNGPLAHAMLSPKRHVDKCYQARVAGLMTEQDQQAFAHGIQLSDHTCLPAELIILSTDADRQESLVQITLREGKFHQVKRMVQACGKTVTDLQRLSMGPLTLPSNLEVGSYRRLTDHELAALACFDVPL